MPAGAGTTAVRNTIYFDGNDIRASLLILVAYLVAGAVAVMAIKKQSLTGTLTEAEASAAAAAVV